MYAMVLKKLKAPLEWAEANPLIEKVGMSVFSTNADAIRLYRRLGFIEEGRRAKQIKLWPGQFVDKILMGRFVKTGFGERVSEIA